MEPVSGLNLDGIWMESGWNLDESNLYGIWMESELNLDESGGNLDGIWMD